MTPPTPTTLSTSRAAKSNANSRYGGFILAPRWSTVVRYPAVCTPGAPSTARRLLINRINNTRKDIMGLLAVFRRHGCNLENLGTCRVTAAGIFPSTAVVSTANQCRKRTCSDSTSADSGPCNRRMSGTARAARVTRSLSTVAIRPGRLRRVRAVRQRGAC